MTPDCCPICKARIPPSASLGMQGIACSQCQTSLWILRHHDDTYFYDTNDMGHFREHQTRIRIERQQEFAKDGWIEIENESELFTSLTVHRAFSLRRRHLIDLPNDDATGLDFSDVEVCHPSPSIEQQEIENNLRQLTMESFLDYSPETDCFVMDVNHSAYRFLPVCVTSTPLKTWPIPVIPWAEFVIFNTGCFSQGLLCNPRTRMMVAYGESFANRFAKKFQHRLVDAELALMR